MIPPVTSFYYRFIMPCPTGLPASSASAAEQRLITTRTSPRCLHHRMHSLHHGSKCAIYEPPASPPLLCNSEYSCETYHCMYPALLLRQCAPFVIRILIYKQTNNMGLSFTPDAKKTCWKIVETSKSSGFGINLGFVKVNKDKSSNVQEVYQRVNCK